MNLHALVVVIVRLLALDFLLRAALQTAPQLFQFVNVAGASFQSVMLPTILCAGMVAVAAVFWFLAARIARLVTRALPQDVSFGSLSLVDCYSLGFVGVGLFYISSYLAPVLRCSHFLFMTATSSEGSASADQVDWYKVMQATTPFLLGVALFVKGRRWAVALARKHRQCEAD